MKPTKILLVLTIFGFLLAACSPASSGSGDNLSTTPFPSPSFTPAASPSPLPSQTSSGNEGGGLSKDLAASPAALAALDELAQQMGVEKGKIKVVKVEPVQWPDGCLGVRQPGIMCNMLVTPGYRVILESNGQQYEYHTNTTGEVVILAGQYIPQTQNKVLVWEQMNDSICSRAEIGEQGVAFGACGGNLTEVKIEPARAAELTYLLATYQPFSGGTKAGLVSFNGQGQGDPTAAEKRSIAEWAHLVFLEAQGGRSGAAWGSAIAWHQEGGIAGVCNDLIVSITGWAVPNSCKPSQSKTFNNYRLSPDELAKLYQWVDQYQNFEFAQKDPAVTDAMKVMLIFTGNGTQAPTAGQQKEIVQFAANIFTDAVK